MPAEGQRVPVFPLAALPCVPITTDIPLAANPHRGVRGWVPYRAPVSLFSNHQSALGP